MKTASRPEAATLPTDSSVSNPAARAASPTNGASTNGTPSHRPLTHRLADGFGVVADAAAPRTAGADGGGSVSIVDGGGPVLTHVHVQLIFWGAAWGGATTPSSAAVTTAVTNLLAGPYMSALAQYRGIGRGSLRGTTTVTTSNPPNPFSDGDVGNLVISLINNNTLPEPDEDTQILYCVIMPPNISSGRSSIGEHTYTSFTDTGIFDSDTTRAHFAWVMNNGTLDFVTEIFSHELAEACSDPEGNAFQIAPSNPTAWNEIGDSGCGCQSQDATLDGIRVQKYWSQRDNACIAPTGIVPGSARGNPSFIQGRFGAKGNFEMVTPLAGGGLAHYWRNNDDTFEPWNGPTPFATGAGAFDSASLIEGNFGAAPGNLELVTRAGGFLQSFWRDGTGWHGGAAFTGNVAHGDPSFIQGRFGTKGNFELVVPHAGGGLAHFWRNNDNPSLPWNGPTVFGGGGAFDGASLIEGNFGVAPGNLEVVARAGASLQAFWRDGTGWHGGGTIVASGSPINTAAGDPVLIQGRFGTKGNFELVVPHAGGGLAHYWRNNDNPSLPWNGPTLFGGAAGAVSAVTMIESNFDSPGNLEVVARVGTRLLFFWRDGGGWHGPFPVTDRRVREERGPGLPGYRPAAGPWKAASRRSRSRAVRSTTLASASIPAGKAGEARG